MPYFRLKSKSTSVRVPSLVPVWGPGWQVAGKKSVNGEEKREAKNYCVLSVWACGVHSEAQSSAELPSL